MKDFKFLGISVDKNYGAFNDISYTPTGEIVTIEGQDRRFQDVSRILLTSLGQFPTPDYGSELRFLLGRDAFDPSVAQEIQSTITIAVGFLALLDPGDSPEESLAAINSINILQDEATPNQIGVEIAISNDAGNTLTFNIGG